MTLTRFRGLERVGRIFTWPPTASKLMVMENQMHATG